jgi:hypothetical protein
MPCSPRSDVIDEDPLEGDLTGTARRARKWGRPVTDEEADALLAELDDALAVLAALVGSAGHPEGDPALFVVRRELDAARARVAALEAVAEAARAALDVDPTSRAGAEAHIRLEAALDAAPAAETASGET